MTRRVANLLWLTVVWVALWENLTWANVTAGLTVAVLVMFVVPVRRRAVEHAVRPWALVRLSAYFALKLVQASAQVAWEVVTPGTQVNAAVVSVPLRTSSQGILTLVANMVTLTPGTLTLEADDTTMTLYIHVLHLRSFRELREGVRAFEERAMAAFPVIRVVEEETVEERG